MAIVLLINETLFYSIYDGDERPFKDVHRESYEEALEIVRRDHPELLQPPSEGGENP